MKNYLSKIQIITAASFLLLYIDGDKVAWFMAFFLPMMIFLTGGGAASPIFEIKDYTGLSNAISTGYLIMVLLSALYIFWFGLKNKLASKLCVIASLFLFSVIFLIMNKTSFSNALSILGLIVFITFNSLSLVINIHGLRKK